MRKVFSVFRSDWRRLTASVVTVVVIIGLCLVPCLYAWFNIFSNWDPYGTSATSNIHIAVASEDEGRDILGVKLNIGDMVIDALHSNDQMGWQFLDTREEALAGVESGEYYAALIMPTDLTSDFVSILEGDLRHPQIQYYENEKKNAIAPKITSKAKTAVQEEINSTVIETVANAVTTANSVFNALGLDAQDVAQRLTVHLEDASASMAQLSATLQSLQSLSDQAGNLIGCAGIVIDDVGNVLQSGQSTIGSASQLLPENAELTEVIDALDRVDQQLDRVQQSIDKALSDAAKWHEFLTGGLDQVDKQLAAQQEKLEELAANPTLDKFPEVRSALQSAIDRIADLRQKIEERPDWENAVEELDGEVSRIRENLRMAVLRANDSVNSALNKMTANAREDLSKLSSVLGTGRQELSGLQNTLSGYQAALGQTQNTLSAAVNLTNTLSTGLERLAGDVKSFSESEAFRQFSDVLENNPDGMADYLSSPVELKTEKVYEISTYGSAMAPYYIMLALFVGSLLTATMVKVQLRPARAAMLGVNATQRYFGRFILFFLIGQIQALVTGLGCLYYIGMQCVNPGRFLLACCVCSLNFCVMNYSLVYALDNIGMALSVIIMVLQVAGSGGTYPIDVVPQLFQTLYPIMPFHYGMDMIRETIGGAYGTTYWKCLGILLGMCVLFMVLGLLLYYPARRLNAAIARSKEATGIM